MKLTTFIMVVALAQVSAKSFSQKISLSSKSISLRAVLKSIEEQSGYVFLSTDYDLSKPEINVNLKNVAIDEALKIVLKNVPLTYSIVDNNIILSRKPALIIDKITHYITAINVKGKVMDEKGQPIAGASVTIESTAIQSVTNSKGEFYFASVPENGVLMVSYVGYEKQRIPLNGRNNFVVTLKVQTIELGEFAIVSTGYQTISKERATGSFSKPDMQLFQSRVGNGDIISRLDGLVPGLTVISGPRGIVSNNRLGNGNSNQKSIIRGLSSVSIPGDPLYVVNGVAIDNINTVNADDIADITVLKDAAASAIWGARAANGVIVITTKKGTKDSKLRVNYAGSVNFSGKPDFGYGKMMNSAQYIETTRALFNPVQFPYSTLTDAYVAPHAQILYDQYAKHPDVLDPSAIKSLDSLASINNLDQIKDLWYQNSMTTNHTLSLSGGNNLYSFYTSAGYSDSRSSQIGQSSQNYRFNFNQEYSPIKRLKLSLVTSVTNSVSKSDRPININNQFLPYQLFQDENSNSISMPYVQGMTPERRADFQNRSRINLNYNPLDEVDYGNSSSNNLNLNLTGEVDLKLIEGLSFHGTYGYRKAPGQNKSYDDSKSYALRKELLSMTALVNNLPVYNLPVDGGTYIMSNNEERNWTIRNQLIYNKALRNDKDQLNIQFGQEARESFSTGAGTTIRGYNQDLQTYPALDYYRLSVTGVAGSFPGGRPVTISGSNISIQESLSRFTSYFALLNYTMDGKYSIDGSWRVDHSNQFGSDVSAQNKPVWSIGGKWNIKKEDFMKSVNWLDGLGLRATYGITGNSPYVGAATLWDVLSVGGGFSTPFAGTGMFISSAANTRLNWERTQTINLGLDFSVLNNRLGGSIDLYHKKTTDLLGGVEVNPLGGFTAATGNIGNLRNKGIELSLRSENIWGRDFSWTTSLNLGYNKNKLISYSAPQTFLNTANGKLNSTYRIGYSLQSMFSYDYVGLDNTGSPMIRLADGTVTKNKAVAMPDDIIYSGTTMPLYSGGLSNSFRYKALTLTCNMIFNLGNVMRRDVNTKYSGRITGTPGMNFDGNLSTYFLDRWKKPGDELFTDIPAYLPAELAYTSTRDVEYYTKGNTNVVSASYVKLRDVTLSYAVPSKLLEKIRIKGANFFIQATNFMIWKANKYDIDPEYNDPVTGTRIIPGFKHSYNIGTNITF